MRWGNGVESWVQWKFTPPGTPWLPIATSFDSSLTLPDPGDDGLVGEVHQEGARGPNSRGRGGQPADGTGPRYSPAGAPQLAKAGKFCGDVDQWITVTRPASSDCDCSTIPFVRPGGLAIGGKARPVAMFAAPAVGGLGLGGNSAGTAMVRLLAQGGIGRSLSDSSGGAGVGGNATITLVAAVGVSGGTLAGGVTAAAGLQYPASGGLLAAGKASDLAILSSAAGGVDSGGQADSMMAASYPASGGVSLGGQANDPTLTIPMPASGGVVMGGVGNAASVYLLDTFQGANGTDLSAHTMDVGPGWSEVGNGNWEIQGNVAVANGGTNTPPGAVVLANAGFADGTITLEFQTSALLAGDTNICFRGTDAANFLMIQAAHEVAGVYITRHQAGGYTALASVPFVFVANTWYTIKLVASGSTITGWVDSTQVGPVTEGFNQTATLQGMRYATFSPAGAVDPKVRKFLSVP